ncbi:MAG: hypothetical protein P3W87_002695 [Gammaproteobacteria bacterium]|nr:hypothetical protein [Gammaproteobacteria bacterium]
MWLVIPMIFSLFLINTTITGYVARENPWQVVSSEAEAVKMHTFSTLSKVYAKQNPSFTGALNWNQMKSQFPSALANAQIASSWKVVVSGTGTSKEVKTCITPSRSLSLEQVPWVTPIKENQFLGRSSNNVGVFSFSGSNVSRNALALGTGCE